MVMDRGPDIDERSESHTATPTAVVAEFHDRDQAESAVAALERSGSSPEEVSLVARGAEHEGDKFIPGTLLITVHAHGREDAVVRILREKGASKVTSGLISATGEVMEERDLVEEREEASSL
jgi:hypothetical protein